MAPFRKYRFGLAGVPGVAGKKSPNIGCRARKVQRIPHSSADALPSGTTATNAAVGKALPAALLQRQFVA
jgi:hypothetical protein